MLVTVLKPSDDGKAWIVRLYGASGKECQVGLSWAGPGPSKTWMSDTSERPIAEIHDPVTVPGLGVSTTTGSWYCWTSGFAPS